MVRDKYSCDGPDCNFESTNVHQADLHRHQVHGLSYECDEEGCTKKFKLRTGLALHKKNKHGLVAEKQCDVPDCDEKYQDAARHRSAHLRSHHPELLKFRCGFCGEYFESSTDKSNHLANRHCKPCPRTLCKQILTPAAFSKHVSNSTIHGYSYSCDHSACHGLFDTPAQLDAHKLNTHNTDEPFACNVRECWEKFGTLGELIVHESTEHTRSICHVCPKTFHDSIDCVRHAFSHHDAESVNCGECSHAMATVDEIINHLNTTCWNDIRIRVHLRVANEPIAGVFRITWDTQDQSGGKPSARKPSTRKPSARKTSQLSRRWSLALPGLSQYSRDKHADCISSFLYAPLVSTNSAGDGPQISMNASVDDAQVSINTPVDNSQLSTAPSADDAPVNVNTSTHENSLKTFQMQLSTLHGQLDDAASAKVNEKISEYADEPLLRKLEYTIDVDTSFRSIIVREATDRAATGFTFDVLSIGTNLDDLELEALAEALISLLERLPPRPALVPKPFYTWLLSAAELVARKTQTDFPHLIVGHKVGTPCNAVTAFLTKDGQEFLAPLLTPGVRLLAWYRSAAGKGEYLKHLVKRRLRDIVPEYRNKQFALIPVTLLKTYAARFAVPHRYFEALRNGGEFGQ